MAYVKVSKEELLSMLKLVNDFSLKFPMAKITEINFIELAKHYNVHPLKLEGTLGFLDAMRVINKNDEKSWAINVDEISKLKIKKTNNEWSFVIYKNAKDNFKIKHIMGME